MSKQLWTIVFSGVLAAAAGAQPPTGSGFDRNAKPGFAPPAGGPSNHGPGGPPPNPMFAAIDADGDGVLTTRELRKAVAALKKMDTDRDGKITLAEVNAPLTQAGVGGSAAAGGFSGGRANFGGQAGLAGRDGIEQGAINQKLMQHDRNGDGHLSWDEVPTELRGSLRGGDANGDGTIDAQELQLITQRMSEHFRGGRPLPPGFNPPAGAGPPKPNGQ